MHFDHFFLHCHQCLSAMSPNAPCHLISQVRSLLEAAQMLRRSEYFPEGLPSSEGPERGGRAHPASSPNLTRGGGWSASEKLKLLQVLINNMYPLSIQDGLMFRYCFLRLLRLHQAASCRSCWPLVNIPHPFFILNLSAARRALN